MKRILIVLGRYLPGYKDGGPVRTTKNIVDQLGKEFDFRIACYDRDIGDKIRYPGIKVNDWNEVGNCLVYYVSEKGFTNQVILNLAKQVDIIYVWGCFNTYSSRILLLKRFGIIKNTVVIASMGLFSPLAFKIKYLKKKSVITIMNLFGVFKNVYWSVTSEMEKQELRQQVWTTDDMIYIAEDLPRLVSEQPILKKKTVGNLKVVWISRIAPKKNLVKAIRILQKCMSNIEFTIYGPIFDEHYWEECKRELTLLPDSVHWEWKGSIESEQVIGTLKEHHVFLFPTFGENYGHVIHEALSAGCACILSNQTPWQDLEEQGIGYVFPLNNNRPFIEAIEKYANMDEDDFQVIVDKAHEYAKQVSNDKVKLIGYRNIFNIY